MCSEGASRVFGRRRSEGEGSSRCYKHVLHKRRGPPDQRRELDVLRRGGSQCEETSGGPADGGLEDVHVALAAAAELLGAAAHLEPPRLEVGLSRAGTHGGGRYARGGRYATGGRYARRYARRAGMPLQRSTCPSPPRHPPLSSPTPPPPARRWGTARWVTLAVAAAHMVGHTCQLNSRRGQRRGDGRGGGRSIGCGGGRGGRCGAVGEETEGARLGVSQPCGAHLRSWCGDGVAMVWRRVAICGGGGAA